jgi:hypothetical protein
MSSAPAPEAVIAAARRRRPSQPVWLRVGVVVGLLALAFVAARGCQQSQVRITKEQAIATAEERIPFRPERVQVRLVRQGLTSRPFWVVSLSVPREGQTQVFDELAVVRVNANTGTVEDVRIQRDAPPPEQK